ncbi:uncharacterized protein LOC126665520 [Mercurialis annua]|uniref:uncharacterized protein LOC126665520 n=1 Tax=Mercurialis annua TaxID=3986 RepID=UPI0021600F16|nr:uncharacterized protein LOC126665520 [Mercurialis annua]
MELSLKKWRNSSYKETVHLGRNRSRRRHEHEADDSKWKWNKLWRKFNRKIFSAPVILQASYDPDEYSQNFDQGTGRTEPDNLSRSFSARYADPSRLILIKNTSVRYVRGI